MYSQANVRVGKCAAVPHPSVAVRDRRHGKGVAGSGWARQKSWDFGQKTRRVERWLHRGAPQHRVIEPVRSPKTISARRTWNDETRSSVHTLTARRRRNKVFAKMVMEEFFPTEFFSGCIHSPVARTFFCTQRAHCVLGTSSCV